VVCWAVGVSDGGAAGLEKERGLVPVFEQQKRRSARNNAEPTAAAPARCAAEAVGAAIDESKLKLPIYVR